MKRQSESSMREHYESWQESGLNKKSFANQEKINPATFYYWVKKFNNEEREPPTKGFHSIVLKDSISLPLATAIVRYPSGVSIEWHGGAETIHLLKTFL